MSKIRHLYRRAAIFVLELVNVYLRNPTYTEQLRVSACFAYRSSTEELKATLEGRSDIGPMLFAFLVNAWELPHSCWPQKAMVPLFWQVHRWKMSGFPNTIKEDHPKRKISSANM